MNDESPTAAGAKADADVTRASLPAAQVKRMRWPFPLIWLVPLLAIAAAVFYLYRHKQEHGTQIDIAFTDVSGLKVDDTPIVVHGVMVGKIAGITLADDQQHAIVHAELVKDASHADRDGTQFWVVRPDVTGGSVMGLGTLVSGPYIEAVPGQGEPASSFTGLDSAPVLVGDGMRIVLTTGQLDHLQVNSAIYFRGVQVGAVQDIRLSSDSAQVNATVVIWKRYRRLLKTTSRFWALSGADVKGGIFSGIQLQVNSLRSLIAGGVAFATPEDSGASVADGIVYPLHAEPEKEWLKWTTRIPIDQPMDDPNPQGTADKKTILGGK